MDEATLLGLAAALGGGLLVGIERERSHGGQAPAGVRTFAVIALLGALAQLLGGGVVLAAFGLLVGAFLLLAYWRDSASDSGTTTEVSALAVFLIGALAVQQAALAVGLAVVLAAVLYAKARLHRLARELIDEQEMRDALLLAAAALVILPLTPNTAMGPYGVFNPRTLWTLAVLVLAINGAGYLALRWLGPRYGLSLAGLASGFVSSTATIGAMAAHAREHPQLRGGAVAGAVLSSLATVIQLALVVAATSLAALRTLALALIFSGVAAAVYGAIFAWRSAQQAQAMPETPGRPFQPRIAALFVAAIATVLLLTAFVTDRFGSGGTLAAAALAGFADAHASAVSAASMAAAGRIDLDTAAIAVLLAFSTNGFSKVVVAVTAGGGDYARRVAPGVVVMTAAAWAGLSLQQVLT